MAHILRRRASLRSGVDDDVPRLCCVLRGERPFDELSAFVGRSMIGPTSVASFVFGIQP